MTLDASVAPNRPATEWKHPPWTMQNGWEQRPILDAEGLAELAHRARSDAWEVYAM